MTPPNTGTRRKVEFDGWHCSITVTNGPDGPAVDATWPDDAPPPCSRTRSLVDGLCGMITAMFTEAKTGEDKNDA